MYYNTTKESDISLKKSKRSAEKQDAQILEIFRSFDNNTMLNPWFIKEEMKTNPPITSVRRSINTLTKLGKLVKTELKVMGPLGRKCYCWRLNQSGE